MKNRRNRHENILAKTVSLCAVLCMIFNAVTVMNIRSYQNISERTEELLERIDEWRKKASAPEGTAFSEQESETSFVQMKEKAAEAISREELQDIRKTGILVEEAGQKDTAETSVGLELENILEQTADIGGKWSVSVMDLQEGAVYGWNEEASMQSASVIKVFIMAAVYERICYLPDEASAIYASEQYEGELKDLLTNMITVSDNHAANRLVELLGYGDFQAGKEAVNSFCQSNGYAGTHLGRRFMEENPQDDNYTTAADCRKILCDIYNGGCVCAEASTKMVALLQNQTVKTKISTGIPESVLSANKTGEMPEGYGLGCIENDIAIVYGEQKDYIICVLANELGGRNEEARQRIGEISRLVYEELR